MKLTNEQKTRMLAEGVMGWKASWYEPLTNLHVEVWEIDGQETHRVNDWDPIHNESHAAEVREAMRTKGYNCLQMHSVAGANMCDFFVDATTSLRPEHSSETPAIAICHAALLAMGLAMEEEL